MNTQTAQLDWREGRRRRAWELKQQGWKQRDIAAALGVTASAVSQWLKRGRERGVEGLRRHPAPGRQPRLTSEQLAWLPALTVALRRATERLRHTRTVIRACISQASYGEGTRHPTCAGRASNTHQWALSWRQAVVTFKPS